LCTFLPAGCIKRIYATKPPKLKIRQHTNNREKVVLYDGLFCFLGGEKV
jgi:hypothetical protein